MLYNNEEIQSLTGFTKKTLIIFRPSEDEWTLSFARTEAVNNSDTQFIQ